MSFEWLVRILKGNGNRTRKVFNPCPNCGDEMIGKETEALIFRPNLNRTSALVDEAPGVDLGFGVTLRKISITEVVPARANIHKLVFCKECLDHASKLSVMQVQESLRKARWSEEEILLVTMAINNLKQGIKLRGYAN